MNINKINGYILVVIALCLLPGCGPVESARKEVVSNRLIQNACLITNYHSAFQQLPDLSENGLSWRVHTLPFMDEPGQELYKKFKLDEPWDSEHNAKLIPLMPECFDTPRFNLKPGYTVFQIPVSSIEGEPTAFASSDDWCSLGRFRDGLDRTVLLIEVNQSAATIWTKPDYWQYSPDEPKRDLGKSHADGFFIATADCSAYLVPNDYDPQTFKALLTRSAGDKASVQGLKRFGRPLGQ